MSISYSHQKTTASLKICPAVRGCLPTVSRDNVTVYHPKLPPRFTCPFLSPARKFICCSATMRAAPSHFASLLPLEECLGGLQMLYFGNVDTAPAGRKTFVLWRPPIVTDWFTSPETHGKARTTTGVVGKEGRGRYDRTSTVERRKMKSRKVAPGLPGGSEREAAGNEHRRETPQRDASVRNISSNTSLRGMEGWRKGPTDNFYNKEYIKLMGAELQRPSSGEAASAELANTANESTSSTARLRKRTHRVEAFKGLHAHDGNGEPRGEAGDPTENISEKTVKMARSPKGATRSNDTIMTLESVVVGASSGNGPDVQPAGHTSNAAGLDIGMDDVLEAVALAAAENNGAEGISAPTTVGKDCVPEEGGVEEQEKTSEWEDGRRRSPICETAQIMAALVKQRVKTLAFCHTRKLTELTLRYGHQVFFALLYRCVLVKAVWGGGLPFPDAPQMFAL